MLTVTASSLQASYSYGPPTNVASASTAKAPHTIPGWTVDEHRTRSDVVFLVPRSPAIKHFGWEVAHPQSDEICVGCYRSVAVDDDGIMYIFDPGVPYGDQFPCVVGNSSKKYALKFLITEENTLNERMKVNSTNPSPVNKAQDRWDYQSQTECYSTVVSTSAPGRRRASGPAQWMASRTYRCVRSGSGCESFTFDYDSYGDCTYPTLYEPVSCYDSTSPRGPSPPLTPAGGSTILPPPLSPPSPPSPPPVPPLSPPPVPPLSSPPVPPLSPPSSSELKIGALETGAILGLAAAVGGAVVAVVWKHIKCIDSAGVRYQSAFQNSPRKLRC